MNLCLDIGNTTFVSGIFDEKSLIIKDVLSDYKKYSSEHYKDYFLSLINKAKINIEDINEIILSSVVPNINERVMNAVKVLFNKKVRLIKDYQKFNFTNAIDNPAELGDDLIADLVGASEIYKDPCIIVDAGTAIKILVLEKGNVFRYANFAPGISLGLDALANGAALLPDFHLNSSKSVLASNTVDCISAGLVFGNADLISGLVNRLENAIGYKCKHVVTGGGSNILKNILDDSYIFDETLTITGINCLNLMNK